MKIPFKRWALLLLPVMVVCLLWDAPSLAESSALQRFAISLDIDTSGMDVPNIGANLPKKLSNKEFLGTVYNHAIYIYNDFSNMYDLTSPVARDLIPSVVSSPVKVLELRLSYHEHQFFVYIVGPAWGGSFLEDCYNMALQAQSAYDMELKLQTTRRILGDEQDMDHTTMRIKSQSVTQQGDDTYFIWLKATDADAITPGLLCHLL